MGNLDKRNGLKTSPPIKTDKHNFGDDLKFTLVTIQSRTESMIEQTGQRTLQASEDVPLAKTSQLIEQHHCVSIKANGTRNEIKRSWSKRCHFWKRASRELNLEYQNEGPEMNSGEGFISIKVSQPPFKCKGNKKQRYILIA